VQPALQLARAERLLVQSGDKSGQRFTIEVEKVDGHLP
jgi:hypothetical protein